MHHLRRDTTRWSRNATTQPPAAAGQSATSQVQPFRLHYQCVTFGKDHLPREAHINHIPLHSDKRYLAAGTTSVSYRNSKVSPFKVSKSVMAPNLEERTNQLMLKREEFRKKLEAFRILLNNYEKGTSIYAIRRNLRELEVEFTAFRKDQWELDDMDESQTQQDRVDLQQTFYTIFGHASAIINNATKQSEPTIRGPTSNISSPEPVELPTIQLPTFSGAYEDWPGFADQFRSTVHDNPRIDDCRKLIYLRSRLTDEAALTISSLNNVATNYSVAWELLEERYNRPAKIVERHLQEIIETGFLSRTAHVDLQSYTTKLEAHYKALEALGKLTADSVLLYLCTSKLDRETDLIWKEKIQHTPFPTFKEFLKFLNDRCRVIESPRTTRQTHGHTFVTSRPLSICSICRGPHKIWTCRTFRTRTIEERFRAAEEISASTNCLMTGHTLSQCTAGSCRICGQRHHTLLHRSDAQITDRTISSNGAPATTLPGKSRNTLKHPNDTLPTGPDRRLQKTQFGRVNGGSAFFPLTARVFHTSTADLEADITRLGELDDKPRTKPTSEANQQYEEHFQNHVQRINEGRSIVALPFNEKLPSRGSSKTMAMKRLASLSSPTRDSTTTKYATLLSEQSDSTLANSLNQTTFNTRNSSPTRELTTTSHDPPDRKKLNPVQDNRVNFESKPTAEVSKSTTIGSSRSISSISIAMFNQSHTLLPASPESRSIISIAASDKSRITNISLESPLAPTTPTHPPIPRQVTVTTSNAATPNAATPNAATPNAHSLPRIITVRTRFGRLIRGSPASQSTTKPRVVSNESASSNTGVPFNATSWIKLVHYIPGPRRSTIIQGHFLGQ